MITMLCMSNILYILIICSVPTAQGIYISQTSEKPPLKRDHSWSKATTGFPSSQFSIVICSSRRDHSPSETFPFGGLSEQLLL